MKINFIQKQVVSPPELIEGHVYMKDGSGLYIYCKYNHTLINLETGHHWADGSGFGQSGHLFTDVTDRVVVQSIIKGC